MEDSDEKGAVFEDECDFGNAQEGEEHVEMDFNWRCWRRGACSG